jgi:anti-sigma B factor antagonist
VDLNFRLEGDNAMVVDLCVDKLDASNVREFKDAIQAQLTQRPHVVLNLNAIEFVDSSGLGALLSCLRAVTGKRGELRLCGLGANVQALFELMRMQRVFHIHPTERDALNAWTTL